MADPGRVQGTESDGQSGTVLVRFATEILAYLREHDSEPVVIVGIESCDDGTHDLVLRSVYQVVPRSDAEALAEALESLPSTYHSRFTAERLVGYREKHPKETP